MCHDKRPFHKLYFDFREIVLTLDEYVEILEGLFEAKMYVNLILHFLKFIQYFLYCIG